MMTSPIQTGFRKRSIQVCLRSFPRRLKYITVERAGELLVKMGRGNEKIWWISASDGKTSYEWTVNQFMTGKKVKTNLANQIRTLEFYGGPPGRMQLHRGTFLTYLMDRLLVELYRGGFSTLDAILPLQENYATQSCGQYA